MEGTGTEKRKTKSRCKRIAVRVEIWRWIFWGEGGGGKAVSLWHPSPSILSCLLLCLKSLQEAFQTTCHHTHTHSWNRIKSTQVLHLSTFSNYYTCMPILYVHLDFIFTLLSTANGVLHLEGNI